jgi:hypothetical protein
VAGVTHWDTLPARPDGSREEPDTNRDGLVFHDYFQRGDLQVHYRQKDYTLAFGVYDEHGELAPRDWAAAIRTDDFPVDDHADAVSIILDWIVGDMQSTGDKPLPKVVKIDGYEQWAIDLCERIRGDVDAGEVQALAVVAVRSTDGDGRITLHHMAKAGAAHELLGATHELAFDIAHGIARP